MENILKAISENLQIATIVAAIIMALGAVVAAIISKEKHRKKKESQGTVIIPPQGDPLGHLKSNLGGIKDIDNMDPQSDEYYKALAARIALQKNDKTIVKISRRGQNGS